MGEHTNGKKIVSGVFWRFGEKITAQAVSLTVSIVLGRILAPEDFGIVGIMSVFIIIAEVFVTSGLGTSLIQTKDATEEDFSTMFWINLGLSLILYGIVFVLSPLIAAFYEIPQITVVLRVFAIRLPISAVNSIQNAYISRRMEFKKFFFATIIGTVISAVVGIGMALNGFGVWALVCQILINASIDTFVLYLVIGWRPSLCLNFERAKPMIRFGWKVLATDLIGTVFNVINDLIIGKKYTEEDLAYYNHGKKFPDLISLNMGATLSAVLFPAMSLSTGPDEIKEIRRKSIKTLGYLLLPSMLGMYVIADNLILVLLKEKWAFSVPYVRISCLAAIASILGSTLIQELKAIGRSDITLRMEFIKKPIFLMIIITSMFFGVRAIAYTLVINEVLAFFFNVIPVKKLIGFDFRTHLGDLLPSLIMSLIMCAIVYLIGRITPTNWLSLGLQIIAGAGVYFGLSWVRKDESFLFLLSFLRGRSGE